MPVLSALYNPGNSSRSAHIAENAAIVENFHILDMYAFVSQVRLSMCPLPHFANFSPTVSTPRPDSTKPNCLRRGSIMTGSILKTIFFL